MNITWKGKLRNKTVETTG